MKNFYCKADANLFCSRPDLEQKRSILEQKFYPILQILYFFVKIISYKHKRKNCRMIILDILNFTAIVFLGYVVGRWADNYLNVWINDPPWIPHHWIQGAVFMTAGIFFLKDNWQLWIFFFGLGLFISDLNDFLDLKFFEPDGKTKENRRFWHID